MTNSTITFILISLLILTSFNINQALAQGNFEDFETSATWPWSPWVVEDAGGTKLAAAAHMGTYGVEDPEWHYRTDITLGNAKDERLEVWFKFTSNNSRAYLGFEADSGGCWSFVAAANTNEFIIQNNVGYSFLDVNNSPQNYNLNQWYKIGITWIDTNIVEGKLYDSDGTSVLATLYLGNLSALTGGIAIRSVNGCYMDDLGGCTLPFAAFGYTIDQFTGTVVQFSDSSKNAGSWSWDFGDGYQSTLQNPMHTYTADGTYEVCLIATSTRGCVETVCVASIIIVETGIPDISFDDNVRIYPNPFSSSATLSFNNYKRDEYIFILQNILGEEVKSISHINSNKQQINRSGLSAGLYLYKVMDSSNNLIGTGKLVVE
ncbi:MAG: PKD domain-containing protein [Bacteroidetes bacterium]|nr:PKD domain-containing protein [Bacteroidota bacterium]